MRTYKLLALIVCVMAISPDTEASAQNPTTVEYAVANFLAPGELTDDCANYASKSEYDGGWNMIGIFPYGRLTDNYVWYRDLNDSRYFASRTWTLADALKNFIVDTGRATVVSSPYYLRPGDLVGCDWGDGNLNESANKNAADGSIDHFLVVTQNLGNGNLMYAQHSPGIMGDLLSIVNNPNMSRARFYYYHVSGTGCLYSEGGYIENRMYRMNGHAEVYLHVNNGFLWVHTEADVDYFGGWGNVQVVSDGSIGCATSGSTPLPGTMVRVYNRPEVYLIGVDGALHHLLSNSAVLRYGGWNGVRLVPDDSLDPFCFSYDIS